MEDAMKIYGAFEAKTHFSQLLALVEKTGEEILIRKRGKDVAVLIPYAKKDDSERERKAQDILNNFKLIRESQAEYRPAMKMTAREMVDFGRKR
jgi:prevent-host-death family protein